MNKNAIVGSACLILAALIVIPSGSLAKGDEDKPLVVEIATSGNDVDATIVNEVAVKNGTQDLTVQVGNTTGEAIPVDVMRGSRIPTYAQDQVQALNNNVAQITFNVPSGKILVIEQVSGLVDYDVIEESVILSDLLVAGQLTNSPAVVPFDGRFAQWRMRPAVTERCINYDQDDCITKRLVFKESVRYYSDDSGPVIFTVRFRGETNIFSGFGVSGYLIPDDEPTLSP
jgi:hypothetical protein